jgi:hypothetical protein
MIPTREATSQRKVTEAFIAADATPITLIPRHKYANGSGGFVIGDGVPRAEQTFRLIPTTLVASAKGAGETTTIDGEVWQPSHILLGRWDCYVDRRDRFVFKGMLMEVGPIEPKQDYEVRAPVRYLRPAIPEVLMPQGDGSSSFQGYMGVYVGTQITPSSTWTFPNPYGRPPTVTVYDSTNEVILAQVNLVDGNVVVHFDSPATGSVVIS